MTAKTPARQGQDKRKMKSAARLYAVQALFQMEASGQPAPDVQKEFEDFRFGAGRLRTGPLRFQNDRSSCVAVCRTGKTVPVPVQDQVQLGALLGGVRIRNASAPPPLSSGASLAPWEIR